MVDIIAKKVLFKNKDGEYLLPMTEDKTGLVLFDTILKDHVLTYEESKGLALQGTYVYKEALAGSRYGYPDFYAKCLEEYNQAVNTETVNGVTVKVHSNGHKFYNIANKTGIDEFFNTYGCAWFYGVDTTNERIFLPRNNWYAIKGTIDSVPVVGTGALGLSQNGTTAYPAVVTTMYGSNAKGPLSFSSAAYASGANGVGYNISKSIASGMTSSYTFGVSPYAENSGLIAQTSDVVQLDDTKYLYICVGNTESQSTITDVVDVTTTDNDTIPLFTGMYFDFKPNNPSWLIGGGQANSGGIYATCYNELVNILNGETKYGDLKVIDVTDMISGVNYSEYWKVDQDAMTFTTPTAISNKALSGAVVGNGKQIYIRNNDNSAESSVWVANVDKYLGVDLTAGIENVGLSTDPTKSGIIAEQSTAQLYFKVANAVQNLELLDVGEVLEAVADVNANVVPNNAVLVSNYASPDYAKAVRVSTSPADLSTFTAPSDGTFSLIGISTNVVGAALSAMSNHLTSPRVALCRAEKANVLIGVGIQVSKGDTINVLHGGAMTFTYSSYTNLGLWFIPTKGGQ